MPWTNNGSPNYININKEEQNSYEIVLKSDEPNSPSDTKHDTDPTGSNPPDIEHTEVT